MGKRHLSRQQQERIATRQTRKLRHAELENADTDLAESGPPLPGLVICHYGQQLEVESTAEASAGKRVRCHQRSNLPPLVAGDRILWQEVGAESGVVVALEPRRNVFSRPGFGGVLKPVAANIDWVLIVLAPVPTPHSNLVDRYLVALETLCLRPLIVLNKTDLLTGDISVIDSMLSLYESIGYPVRRLSARDGTGVTALRRLLEGSTSVFVGQSGVGKSSLINALYPELTAAVGDLSQGAAKGTHTTTSARLFHTPGFDLIDSPGIREFKLWQMEPDRLLAGFVEFRPFLGHCRFRDCRHGDEPGCALRTAVDQGLISSARMQACLQIRNMLDSEAP